MSRPDFTLLPGDTPHYRIGQRVYFQPETWSTSDPITGIVTSYSHHLGEYAIRTASRSYNSRPAFMRAHDSAVVQTWAGWVDAYVRSLPVSCGKCACGCVALSVVNGDPTATSELLVTTYEIMAGTVDHIEEVLTEKDTEL